MRKWLNALLLPDRTAWLLLSAVVGGIAYIAMSAIKLAGASENSLSFVAIAGIAGFVTLLTNLGPDLVRLSAHRSQEPALQFAPAADIAAVSELLKRGSLAGDAAFATWTSTLARCVHTWSISRETVQAPVEVDDITPSTYARRLADQLGNDANADFAARILERDRQVRSTLAHNAPHALVFDDPSTRRASAIRYFPARYSLLCALLQEIDALGESDVHNVPLTLGCGGLLVAPDQAKLVFLRRSASKTLHPDRLHVFGGNFEPSLQNLQEPQGTVDAGLAANAIREIAEEAGVQVPTLAGTYVVSHMETADPTIIGDTEDASRRWALRMRNLPIHFCGVSITGEQLKLAATFRSTEGRPEIIGCNELEAALRNTDQWVPAGWLTTVLWLWSGAHCQGIKPVFSAAEARMIAERILRSKSPLFRDV